MHPFIGQDEFRIKMHEVLNDDFKEVHPIVLELRTEVEHIVEVQQVHLAAAQLMRVVFFESVDDGALVVAVGEELSETEAGGGGGVGVDEGFDEEVVDDPAGLLALAAVDSEDLEEEGVVVREGRFEPPDPMKKKI